VVVSDVSHVADDPIVSCIDARRRRAREEQLAKGEATASDVMRLSAAAACITQTLILSPVLCPVVRDQQATAERAVNKTSDCNTRD
jgi:hypothetical protein